jgi:hypothetical protein
LNYERNIAVFLRNIAHIALRSEFPQYCGNIVPVPHRSLER